MQKFAANAKFHKSETIPRQISLLRFVKKGYNPS